MRTEHPRFGQVRTLASPVRVGDPAALTYRRGPARNEDADHVLRDVAGYDDTMIATLADAGAFGGPARLPEPTTAAVRAE